MYLQLENRILYRQHLSKRNIQATQFQGLQFFKNSYFKIFNKIFNKLILVNSAILILEIYPRKYFKEIIIQLCKDIHYSTTVHPSNNYKHPKFS